MTEPYYSDDRVTLYHGDCREITEWLAADVLVTDPPYGRAWKQGEVNAPRGLAPSAHDGIAGDADTGVRDAALALWGDRAAVTFGDLMLPPPTRTRHVLIYDKGDAVGFHGAVGGYRRNAEAVYLVGSHGSGLGGASCVLRTSVGHPGVLAKATGHPHTKPLDVMCRIIHALPPGIIADPFAGSGSTLVAAKQLGRHAIGVELEERYCEVIAKRLAQDVLDFGGIA